MKRIKESEVVRKKSFRPCRMVMFKRDDGGYATYVEMLAEDESPSLAHGVFYDTYEQATTDLQKGFTPITPRRGSDAESSSYRRDVYDLPGKSQVSNWPR